MDAVIINFEKLKEEHAAHMLAQKEQLIFECQQEIIRTEQQIQFLVSQINDLQSNIDFNQKLIAKITKQ